MRRKTRGGNGDNPNVELQFLVDMKEDLENLGKEMEEIDETEYAEFIKEFLALIDRKDRTVLEQLYRLLSIVIEYGEIHILEPLLKAGMNINLQLNGSTPLHSAIRYGYIEVIKLLLKWHADPNAKDREGLTPLCLALEYKLAESALLLLKQGADPKIGMCRDGLSYIQFAVKNRDADNVRILLERGMDPNVRDKDGITPLHSAIRKRDNDIATLLLDKGADPTIEDNDGNTPFYYAVSNDNDTIVRKILSLYDIDLEKPNKYGVSPIGYAFKYKKENVLRVFQDKIGSSISTCIDYTTQASGTCYYNTILNAIFLSPRLLHLARFKFYEYIKTIQETPNSDITYNDIIDKRVHIRFAMNSGEIILNLSDTHTTTDDRVIYFTQKNKNEIAKFMVMKTIYLFMCDLDKLKKLRYQKKPSCPIYIHDYIQLLATLTLYIQKGHDFKFAQSRRDKKKYQLAAVAEPVSSPIQPESSVPLYLIEGGPPFYTFKTVLKYIYDYKTEYKRKVQIKNIKSPPTIGSSCEVLILINPTYERLHGIKDSIDAYPIEQVGQSYKDEDSELLKDELMIGNTRFVLDHASIVLSDTEGGHAIVGTVCGTGRVPIYTLVDSNDRTIIADWRRIPFMNKSTNTEFIEKIGYSYKNISLKYVCYVRADIESLYPMVQENMCPGKMGGGSVVSYKGRKYKVRVGKRGGKYILVGKDKSVVYLSGTTAKNNHKS